jgi:hypothetical protein
MAASFVVEREAVAARACPRCSGPTLRAGLCGICLAMVFGMSDEQVECAIERLERSNSNRAINWRNRKPSKPFRA